MDEFRALVESWDKREGTTEDKIAAVEEALNVRFPEDYRDFLLWSNGGAAPTIDEEEICLWEIEEILQLNEDYEVSSYLPGVIGIGSDLGGECYALDYRGNVEAPSFVRVPYGDLRAESVVYIGETFREGIENRTKA